MTAEIFPSGATRSDKPIWHAAERPSHNKELRRASVRQRGSLDGATALACAA